MTKSTPIRSAFETFVSAASLATTLAAFADVQQLTKSSDYESLRCAVRPHVPHRLARLFDLLDERRARVHNASMVGDSEHSDSEHSDDSKEMHTDNKNDMSGTRVAIVGAGPCGLRAAVELLMLGCAVTLIEKRDDYSRLNVIKTWGVTVDDLFGFGLPVFVPSAKKHGVLHVGTKDMQMTLTKVALLFGAHFVTGRSVLGVIDDGDDQWSAVLAPRDAPSTAPGVLGFVYGERNVAELEQRSLVDFVEEGDESAILESASGELERVPFEHLLLAEGERARLTLRLGFSRRVTRYASAIGLVANFARPAADSKALADLTFVSRVGDLSDTAVVKVGRLASLGIHCENAEVLLSSEAIFIVSTVLKKTLVERRVMRSEAGSTMRAQLEPSNIDEDKLRELVCDMARALGVPEPLQFSEFNPIQLFDFSAKSRCETAARRLGEKTLVLPIGDALASPFWPQGLGVNRGFHSALDAANVLRQHASGKSGVDPIELANFHYRAAHWFPFFARMLAPAKNWTCDATSRYDRELFRQMHYDQNQRKRGLQLPDSIREHFGWQR